MSCPFHSQHLARIRLRIGRQADSSASLLESLASMAHYEHRTECCPPFGFAVWTSAGFGAPVCANLLFQTCLILKASSMPRTPLDPQSSVTAIPYESAYVLQVSVES